MPARFRTRAVSLGAVVALLLSACGTTATPSPVEPGETMVPQPGVLATVLQTGLEVPWDLAFTPPRADAVNDKILKIELR